MTFCKAGRVQRQEGGIEVEALLIRIKLSLQTSLSHLSEVTFTLGLQMAKAHQN